MAITLGEAILYLRGDGKDLDKSLRDADKNARGVLGGLSDFANKGFSGLKKAVGIGLVAGIGAAIVGIGALGAGLVGAVQAGSDVEEMMGKFSIVFANTGDKVTSQLDEFGRAVGRNKYELREMAATFGDTLKPMGFTEEAAAGLSVDLSKLAVDLGSFNNMETDEALRRLQGTLIGSHENALAFGVVINENTLKAELAANGWDKLTGTQLEQAKVQARINLLMKGTTDAQGDAARTSGGWANQMRRLKSILQETQAEIGTKLLPVLTPLLTKLGDLATQYAPQAIDAFTKILDRVVAFTVALLGWDTAALPFLGTLSDMAGRIMEVAQPVLDAIGSFVEWQDVLIALGVVVAHIVLPFLWGLVVAATPIIAIAAALIAAVALLRKGWESDFGGMRTIITSAFGIISENFQGLMDGSLTLSEALGNVFGGIVALIQGKLPDWIATLQGWGTAIWQWIVDAIPPVLEKLKEWGDAIWQWVLDALPGWIETLQGWGEAIWQWIVDAIPVVLEKLGEWGAGLIEWLADKLPDWIAGIYEWATALISWIGEAIPKAIDSLTEFIENLGKEGDTTGGSVFGEMVAKWVGLLIDWVVTDLIPKVGPAFLKFATELLLALGKIALSLALLAITLGTAIMDGIAAGVEAGAQMVADAVLNAAKAAWEAAKNFLGIGSPSRLFSEIGNQMMAGFAVGVGGNDDLNATLTTALSKMLTAWKIGLSAMKSMWDTAWAELNSAWEELENWLDTRLPEAMGKLVTAWETDWTAIIRAVTGAWLVLLVAFTNIRNWLDNLLPTALTTFHGWLSAYVLPNPFAAFINAIGGVGPALDGARGVINNFSNWLGGVRLPNPFAEWERILDRLAEKIKAIQTAISALGGGGSSTSGGSTTVPYNTGYDEYGQPKVGTRLSGRATLQAQAVGSGGGITVNMYATVNNDLDVEEMAWRVAQMIQRRGR